MESWEESLRRGDTEAAWNLFMERYRRLIIDTIRRTLDTHEDLPDVLADVCHGLSANDFASLRRYTERPGARARFSTWLVVVVRNQTIDWIRRQSGRRRVSPPTSLSPLQAEIFQHVFVERLSHVEAYELLTARHDAGMKFGAFLRELSDTYRKVERSSARGILRYLAPAPAIELHAAPHPEEVLLSADARERLIDVLGELPEDVRLAVLLFVVNEVPAADVARTVGWRNAKEVYNRVYRTLEKLRHMLEERGLRSGDL